MKMKIYYENKKYIMKIRNIIARFLYVSVFITFTACSNTEENFFSDGQKGEKGIVYSANIVVSSENGNKEDNVTRGLDTENGLFTAEYPYGYIYLHRADNIDGEDHKSIKIPLDRNVDYCESCKAIHLDVEVFDGDGGYIVRNGNNEISLKNNETVYFSTIPDTYWKADVADKSPMANADVFFQTDGVNTELLRSTQNYTKEQLINLLQQGNPRIEMTRHSTAFRVALMCTADPDGDRKYHISETQWSNGFFNGTTGEKTEGLGADYGVKNFYIKLYMGPDFCKTFNVQENSVPETDQGGYYATNEGKYQSFENSEYAYQGGGSSVTWQGFGYMTEAYNYLIAPLNLNNTAPFTIYAYVKYCAPGQTVDDDSDEGSKRLTIPIRGFKLQANKVHFISIVYNFKQLEVFKQSTTESKTRMMWSEPEDIELKPIAIICK